MAAPGMIAPLWPRPTARLASATAASIDPIGSIAWGMKRGLAAAHTSIIQSLYTRAHSI